MSSTDEQHDVFWDLEARGHAAEPTTTTKADETPVPSDAASQHATLSLFESVVTTYPPILESLLCQLPTGAILNVYHTSTYLRDFLRKYPLAWKTLSFRLPQPAVVVGSPGNETPDGRDRQSKTYSFDALLKQVICPYGTRLKSLDLCNTAVSGIALVGSVLAPRIDTLEHLSVRGCKNVSLKYHIVPFLEPYTMKDSPWIQKDLALKSLYTYRCRHHRRRPYLPASLARRDSDSDPTHQLIEICHQLSIWTDTAWCPTPGGRCYRRKDYHSGRAGPQSLEVWVPFDRLWRSSNRIGPTDSNTRLGATDGRLWEIAESGQDGEPLGTENGPFKGEGKHVPTHLRKSHKMFVEDFKCAQCNDAILERCESCCVRMHCMGCRKTLCASCAFNRPIPRKRVKTRHFQNLAFGLGSALGSTLGQASGSSASLESQRSAKLRPTNRFWWAPGATRSPNLMNEAAHGDDSSDSEDGGNFNNGIPAPPNMREPPKLNMHWCCLEPIFSGGGGIAVVGTGLGGRGADNIRAVPLPRTKQFEDTDFSNQLPPLDYIRELKHNGLYEYVLGEDVDILSYLKQDSLDLQAQTCPRGLCQDCYRSFRWKVSCRCCKNPLCKEHDFRGLKFRKCGFRDMHTEREYVRTHHEPPRLAIPDFNPNKPKGKDLLNASSIQQPSVASDSDPETSEPTPMSQSQILVPPSIPSAVDMSASASLSSHASSTDPFLTPSSLPFVPVSSSRPRSFSASGVRGRNSGSWPNSPRAVNPITNPLPLPCHPRHPVQWEGCGSYFCQYPRPVGDNRNQCPAILKECTECQVLVCDACAAANPSCTCTYCTINYHCPHCTRKKEVVAKCRLEEEIKAKKEAELRAKEKMEKEKEERGQADEMAGAVAEFWSFLTNEVMAELAETSPGGEVMGENTLEGLAELPAPSPDSITVTTEFGVTQEPNSVTTISAAVPPPTISAEESPEQHEQAIQEGFNESILQATPVLSAPPMPMSFELEVEPEDMDMVDDEEDDADFEDDDIDAESALIDEFIDDGALTPITTTDT
ncbi:uncharacterized protein BDR25DRAFT_231396 [Lindgomyces ingoldianus]|uniref:Uncharacterized protein n=1 Tax=Lindgomyces ingoldianus TaxID=673940 RepID=A0ACB6QNH1_9PLEO|nr:uncharacterized protein BDR25DRAFT_231396 [Lindgomyces ingoldianus]KAF2468538.1 hypothetical protein BDR25DRAFT_231396 [Lindgomyces ingoldianus]